MRRSERIANAITHAHGQPNPALIDRLIEQNLTRSVDPLSSLSIATTARLVRTIDGRPIRSIVTGRRHVVTGSYASRKAGRAFPFESMNERAFFMHSEVTPRVVDFRAQPFRFEFALEGEKRIYIADAARLLDDGTFEVVEIKNDRRALRDPLYAAKLQQVRTICTSLGWNFRIMLSDELLKPKWRFEAITDVQSRRMTRFSERDLFEVSDHLSRHGGRCELGALAGLFSSPVKGRSIVQAMMVLRHLEIDLSGPVTDSSLVATLGLGGGL